VRDEESTKTIAPASRIDTINSARNIIDEMRSKILAVFENERVGIGSNPVRLSIEIPGWVPLRWLTAQKCDEKVYWAGRDGKFVVAGIGTADYLMPNAASDARSIVSAIQDRLDKSPEGMRYLGGFRFDQSAIISENWQAFGRARFILPRFELTAKDGRSSFVCNLIPDADRTKRDEIIELLDSVTFDDESLDHERHEIVSRQDKPDFTAWRAMLAEASQAFSAGNYEKIVLARESTLKLSAVIDPSDLLETLASEATGCFHFAFQPKDATAFIGASPERLYSRQGSAFECEALAGTRPRGNDATEDTRFGEQLLQSEKDAREHRYVVEGLRESLDRFLSTGFPENGSSVTLRKLARVQHLVIQFDLKLRAEVGDGEILEALHPTPAVGGYPREGIARYIADLEPFDRGWYAGPVGWIARGSAEFAVAIRSGLINGNNLSLYAGAGILKGSDVSNEWNELENKLGTFLNAVNR
jgi:menaquinone-specific isochorismate synthase